METKLSLSLKNFRIWLQDSSTILQEFYNWGHSSDLFSVSEMLEIESLIKQIPNEFLKISLVGHFSSGKSEVINGFLSKNSDSPKRILPSQSGQTSMCPVEVSSTLKDRPYMELLPIQTRGIDIAFPLLMKSSKHWSESFFLEESIPVKQASENICLSKREAEKIGFDVTKKNNVQNLCKEGEISIPKWRYIRLFLENDFLQQGISFLDTPGWNSIGNEFSVIEDSVRMSDAIIVVSTIDTGVNEKDLSLWKDFISPLLPNKPKILFLLNKKDSLEDGLRSKEEISSEIEKISATVAERLSISKEQVLAVSAKNFLFRSGDSGFDQVEDYIATYWVKSKIEKLSKKILNTILSILKDKDFKMKEMLSSKMNERSEVEKLLKIAKEEMPEKIKHNREKLISFHRDKVKFESDRSTMDRLSWEMVGKQLNIEDFDRSVEEFRKQMLSSWTTSSLFSKMQEFFVQSIFRFDMAVISANEVSELLKKGYKEILEKYGIADTNFVPNAIIPRRAEIMELADSYERFGQLANFAAKTQSSIVNKTFLTTAEKIRRELLETQKDVQLWLHRAVDALSAKLNEYEKTILQKILECESIYKSVNELEEKLTKIENEIKNITMNMKKSLEFKESFSKRFAFSEERKEV